MSKAQDQLDQDQGDEAGKQEEEALADLNDAQDELEQARKEAEEQLAMEQLARMGDQLKSLAERQNKVVSDLDAYEKLRVDSNGKLTIAQKAGVRGLGQIQSGLKEETGGVIEQLEGARTPALRRRRQLSHRLDRRLGVVQEEVTRVAPGAGARDVADRPMKPYQSHRVALRGLDSHVLTWGDAAAPKLFLLHGWMDVAASFQFLVDALARERYVIAPDLRGYGKSAWQPQGYWYADYVADLEALLNAFAPGESVDIAGHSLGGNVVLHYAGIRPARARRVISLNAFGVRAEDSSAAAEKYVKWLDVLEKPQAFSTYESFDAVAERLQKNSRHLSREQAAFLARHSGRRNRRTAGCAFRRIRGTSCRFPPCIESRRRMRSGGTSRRRRCGSRPPTRTSRSGSTIIRKGEGAADSFHVVKRRFAHIPNGRLVTIAEAAAGHHGVGRICKSELVNGRTASAAARPASVWRTLHSPRWHSPYTGLGRGALRGERRRRGTALPAAAPAPG